MSRRKHKKASDRIKSLQEIKTWLLTHKKCDNRTSAIRYLNIFISHYNSSKNVVIMAMDKNEYRLWEEFKREKSKFLKYKAQL